MNITNCNVSIPHEHVQVAAVVGNAIIAAIFYIRSRGMKYLLALLCVALVGCEKVERSEPTLLISHDQRISVDKYEDGTGYYVRDFHLKDGTRCVTYAVNGITCDWKKPEVERD